MRVADAFAALFGHFVLSLALRLPCASQVRRSGLIPYKRRNTMRTTRTTLCLTALSLALVTGFAQARSDSSFMKDAAEAGHAEVEASKIAQTKAKSPQVKEFADKMIADHTKLAEDLSQLASAKNVALPSDPSVVQKAKLKVLDVSDDSFDKRYVKTFGVAAHKDAVKLFQDASRSKDADVKAFAQKALPELQHHLQMAQSLAAGHAEMGAMPQPILVAANDKDTGASHPRSSKHKMAPSTSASGVRDSADSITESSAPRTNSNSKHEPGDSRSAGGRNNTPGSSGTPGGTTTP
jgi:putative membrane protein